MDSEKSDSRYDLHHNYFVRGRENIAAAFFENSQYLKARRNGNYLYHEIISITLEDGVERTYAKECLREITLKYIEGRCPRNMVYACLHEDHADHLHYHLMISANEKDEAKRHWLTKKQFDTLKRDVETHVLENYPELKQRKIITADQKEKKLSRKASAQKRRTGKLDRQEWVKESVFKAMVHTSSFADFEAKLKAQGFEYYRRGKNHGVKVSHDDGKVQNYRFSTIGAGEAFEEYLKVLDSLKTAETVKEPVQEARAEQAESFSATDTPKDEEATQERSQKRSEPPETPPPEASSKQEEAPTNTKTHENTAESVTDIKDADAASDAAEVTQDAQEGQESETLREFRERREAREARKREKALKAHEKKGKPRGR